MPDIFPSEILYALLDTRYGKTTDVATLVAQIAALEVGEPTGALTSGMANLFVNDLVTKGPWFNVKATGAVGDGVADDKQAILDAISAANGVDVFLPAGVYKLGASGTDTLLLSNYSRLRGVKPSWNGTTFVNGTVILGKVAMRSGAHHARLTSLGVINTGVTTGTTDAIDIDTGAHDCELVDVVAHGTDHGISAADKGTVTYNNVARDCATYGGKHGFDVKSRSLDLINCKAFGEDGVSLDGFVIVSDNIIGAGVVSEAKDVRLINCTSVGAAAQINIYGRDYTSENNAAGIVPPTNITIIGGNFSDSDGGNGLNVGDYGTAPAGQTYLDPVNVNVIGPTFRNNPNGAISFRRCNGALVTGCNFSDNGGSEAIYKTPVTAKNVRIGANNYGNDLPGNAAFWTTLTVDSTAPTIQCGGELFKTANTTTTNIINFADGLAGQIVTIVLGDSYTTLVKSSNMALMRSLAGTGAAITLRMNDAGSQWEELWRSDRKLIQSYGEAANVTIDFSLNRIATLYFNSSNANLTFTGAQDSGPFHLVAWTGSAKTLTFPGNVKLSGANPRTPTAGKKLCMTFFFDGTNYQQIAELESAQ